MAGPAAALIPLSGVKEATKVLTGDLITLRGQVFRVVEHKVGKKTEKFLAPVDVEAHVNPLSLALAGGGAGFLGLMAWVVWNGLSLPAPFGPVTLLRGLKDSEEWEWLKDWWEKRTLRGIPQPSRVGLTSEEIRALILEEIGDTECQLLNREWAKATRRGRSRDADRFLQQATTKGCPWIGQI